MKLISKFFLIVIILLVPFSSSFAISLEDAKSQGKVGEMKSGYLAVVGGQGSSEINSLIVDINSKRKAEYSKIAKKNRASLKSVEILAGKKAIGKTASGNYIEGPQGKMQKK